jgi:phenylacetate-CoA ligase
MSRAPLWQRAATSMLRSADTTASRLWPRAWRDEVAVRAGAALDRLYGRDVDDLMPAFSARERMSARDWRAYQENALHALLLHCQEHVPAYRDALARYDARASAMAQLSSLPVLSKDTVRNDANALHATDIKRSVITARTSGSTGRPLVVDHDLLSAAHARAAQRRAFLWFGVHPYATRVMLLAMPRDQKTHLKNLAVDVATSRRLVEFYDVSDVKLNDMVAAVASHRPTLLTGYASVLHELSSFIVHQNIDTRAWGIRLVHSQSEMLLDIHRASIAQAFPGTSLMNEYGSVEVGAMAYTCEHGSMHASPDHVIIEVVDDAGTPVPDGTRGHIVFTPLHARAMPLLRYAIGDEGSISHESCKCGRFDGQAIVASLDGRVFERIVTANGTQFSAGMVHFLIRKAELHARLHEYLAIQRQPGALHFLLVSHHDISSEDQARLQHEAHALFGADFVVTSELVTHIERTKRKRSYFSSELPT